MPPGMLLQAGGVGEVPPLLSARLHGSWIADVQLIPTSTMHGSHAIGAEVADGAHASVVHDGHADNYAAAIKDNVQVPLLLSASNDGTVALWDLSKCCEQGRPDVRPRQLAQTDALHTGEDTTSRCFFGTCNRSLVQHHAMELVTVEAAMLL